MKLLSILLACLVATVIGTGPIPVARSGLAGIAGFTFYDPYCGHGCFRSFSVLKLDCSSDIMGGGHTTGNEAAHHLAICRASNFPYLSSIAWCMHLYCPKDVLHSKIEHFWETQITGDVKVLPQWSYGEVLANITDPPTMLANASDMTMTLNMTMITTKEGFDVTWTTLYYFFRETALESYYGCVITIPFSLYILSSSLFLTV
jgi:hypothetical protein